MLWSKISIKIRGNQISIRSGARELTGAEGNKRRKYWHSFEQIARYRVACNKITKLLVIKSVKWVVGLNIRHLTTLQYMQELTAAQIHDTQLDICWELFYRRHWRSHSRFIPRKGLWLHKMKDLECIITCIHSISCSVARHSKSWRSFSSPVAKAHVLNMRDHERFCLLKSVCHWINVWTWVVKRCYNYIINTNIFKNKRDSTACNDLLRSTRFSIRDWSLERSSASVASFSCCFSLFVLSLQRLTWNRFSIWRYKILSVPMLAKWHAHCQIHIFMQENTIGLEYIAREPTTIYLALSLFPSKMASSSRCSQFSICCFSDMICLSAISSLALASVCLMSKLVE